MKIKIYSYSDPEGRKDMFARTARQAIKMENKEKNKVINDLLDGKYNWKNPLEVEVKDSEAFEELEGAASCVGIWASPVDPDERKRLSDARDEQRYY